MLTTVATRVNLGQKCMYIYILLIHPRNTTKEDVVLCRCDTADPASALVHVGAYGVFRVIPNCLSSFRLCTPGVLPAEKVQEAQKRQDDAPQPCKKHDGSMYRQSVTHA